MQTGVKIFARKTPIINFGVNAKVKGNQTKRKRDGTKSVQEEEEDKKKTRVKSSKHICGILLMGRKTGFIAYALKDGNPFGTSRFLMLHPCEVLKIYS